MMSWLKRVIARLLMRQTPFLDKPVKPTQTAGLALQTPTTKTGNKRSVATTKPRNQSKSVAQQASAKKPKVAKPTTAELKDLNKKPKPVQTAKSRTTAGNSTQTVAPRTRQAAKPAPKRKP